VLLIRAHPNPLPSVRHNTTLYLDYKERKTALGKEKEKEDSRPEVRR
jgi:hypothetical protein